MNVFEDLISELRDENLLEDTVIDVKRNSVESFVPESEDDEIVSDELDAVEFETNSEVLDADSPEFVKPAGEQDFFRKRAMEEVSSLQMVEHVLSGVEREHMKVPAALYDDFAVKRAQHRFMQVSGDSDPEERADAEFQLLQETQGWHTALSVRDKQVSVANIRRFCENSQPVLSSQALMALARFYRNSPFTEDVRSKFDFVMTRLFARDAGMERRKLLFGRDEMVGHIKTLYANWSSIEYHPSDENKETIDLSVQRFDDLAEHFEAAESFDGLLNADVFNSIRLYKEECGELFYAPEITAAAIDCNVRLGNKYVYLIFKEKGEVGPAKVSDKYGFKYDLSISNAAGKTLLLEELLRFRPEDSDSPEEMPSGFEQESFDISRSVALPIGDDKKGKRSAITGINKWLVAATLLVALVSGGVYFWADKFAGSDTAVSVANEVDLEGTDLKAHLRTMRLSNGTAYGVMQPSWDAMTESDQKAFLKKVYEFAQTKKMVKVNLLNYKGKTVGYATKDRLDIYPPS